MPETNAILYVNCISINLEKNTYEARGALGLPGCSVNKESAYNAVNPGSILGWADPLEKGMATHSSILAWRIPWTEEPGELQSMGLQRVGHD